MHQDRTAIDIRSRRARSVSQVDEFLRRARLADRQLAPVEPSAEVRRLATALEGMVRHALPHIDDNENPVVRVDVADPTNGADALTLCLPRQIADLLVLAVATIGEQYRDKPVPAARPALHVLAGGAR
ncbi:hypothetical protein [Streptomyces tubercidicus]|uniref:hypothetical protein n=1 Tax=Streptomyces tubercidicus TaxID=47759 RepID=UPI0034669CCD